MTTKDRLIRLENNDVNRDLQGQINVGRRAQTVFRHKVNAAFNPNNNKGLNGVGVAIEGTIERCHGVSCESHVALDEPKASRTELFCAGLDANDLNQVKPGEAAETSLHVANETETSVIIFDQTGLIEYINPGFAILTGYASEIRKDKKPENLLQSKKTDPAISQWIGEKLDNQTSPCGDLLNYRKDGEAYFISLALDPGFRRRE